MANAQLVLLPTDSKWKLDEDTRRIGRAGLAQARAILAEAPEATDLLVSTALTQPETSRLALAA